MSVNPFHQVLDVLCWSVKVSKDTSLLDLCLETWEQTQFSNNLRTRGPAGTNVVTLYTQFQSKQTTHTSLHKPDNQ